MTMPGQVNTTVYLGANISGYQQGLAQADRQTRGFMATIDALTHKMSQVSKGVGDVLQRVGKAGFAGLGAATADAATFQKQLSTLAGQSAITGRSMKLMTSGIEDSFRNLPVSRGEIVQLTQALSQLGVRGSADLQKLVVTYEKLGAITGENPVALGAGMQQLNQVMGGAGADQVMKFANALATVSANAGVSAQGTLDFAQNLAPIAHMAGVTTPAVIGISAAFNKAGQDGRVAANTFSSILYDVQHAIQTGSPAIAQYASLVGMTVTQFKALSGTTQILDVLNKLGGPGGAVQLEQLGYEGIRNQQAIAAVTQSGDLGKLVNDSINASMNTNNLDKGSTASWNNIVDQSVRLRNAFTDIGGAIGATFLTPMTKATEYVADMAHWIDVLVSKVGPLISIFGAAGSSLAFLTGTLVHFAGLLALPILGRFLLRSTGVAAFSAGRYMQAGETPKEGSGAARATEAYLAGNMRPYQIRAMEQGANFEAWMARRQMEGAGLGVPVGQMARMAALAPVRTARWIWRDTMNFTNEAMRNDFQRQGLQWGEGGGLGQAYRNLRDEARKPFLSTMAGTTGSAGLSWYQNLRTTGRAGGQLARELYGGFTRAVAGTGPLDSFKVGANWSKYEGYAKIEEANAKAMAETGKGLGAFEKALMTARVQVGAFGDGMRAAGMSGLRMGAAGALGGLGLAARGVGMAAGALFSPLGLVGLTAGTMLYQHVSENADKARELAATPFGGFDPLKQYNQELGISTSSMGTFTSAVDDASQRLNTLLAGITSQSSVGDVVKAVGNLGPSVVRQADTDSQLVDLYHSTGNGNQKGAATALGQLFQGYGFTDVRQIQVAAASALKAGFTTTQVQQAVAMLPNPGTSAPAGSRMAGRIQNFGAFGEAVQNASLGESSTLALGLDSVNPNAGALAQVGNRIDRLQGGIQANTDLYNGQYANLYAGANQLSLLSAISTHVREYGSQVANQDALSSRRDLTAVALKRAFSLKTGAGDIATDLSNYDFGVMNDAQRQRALLRVIADSKGGAASLKQFFGTSDINRIDPTKFSAMLQRYSANPTDNATINAIRQLPGQFGVNVTDRGGSIQQGIAAGTESAKFIRSIGDMAKMADTAAKAAGRNGDAALTSAEQLGRLEQNAGGSTTALYQMAQAAQSMTDAERAVRMTQSTRLGGFSMQLQDFQSASRLAQDPNATNDQIKAVQPGGAAWQQYQGALESQRQFLIQQMMQVKSFDKSMLRAQEDYTHARLLEEQNFQIQLGQMDQDFQIQQQRSQADFNRQMTRQAEDAAKNIYDPFARIQPKAINDTRSVLANLADQNAAINKQRRELAQLRRQGVSQQTIDTLQLNDPNNAQQLDRMVQDLTNDPTLAAQINRQVAQRVQATGSLVNSNYNQSYRRTVADFTRQTSQAIADFNRQRDRMIDANTRSMNEQALQFRRTMNRSKQDMVDTLTEISGDLGSVVTQSMDLLTSQMSKYAPQVASVFEREVGRIKTAYENSLAILNLPTTAKAPSGGTANPGRGAGSAGGGGASTRQGPSTADLGYGANTPVVPSGGGGGRSGAGNGHFQHPPANAPTLLTSGLWPSEYALFGWMDQGVHTYAALGRKGFSKAQMQHFNKDVKAGVIDMEGEPHRFISGVPAHYLGGIFTTPHIGTFAEHGPEMGIPLDGRGQAFLTDMYRAISMTLASQLHGAVTMRGTAAPGGDTVYDYHTEFTGDIHIQANDVRKLQAELDSLVRLKRLAQPPQRGKV